MNFDDCVMNDNIDDNTKRNDNSKASQNSYSDVTKHKNKPFFCCKKP